MTFSVRSSHWRCWIFRLKGQIWFVCLLVPILSQHFQSWQSKSPQDIDLNLWRVYFVQNLISGKGKLGWRDSLKRCRRKLKTVKYLIGELMLCISAKIDNTLVPKQTGFALPQEFMLTNEWGGGSKYLIFTAKRYQDYWPFPRIQNN